MVYRTSTTVARSCQSRQPSTSADSACLSRRFGNCTGHEWIPGRRALPLVTITGSQLISVASGVKAGQTVLVSGAADGVGRAAARTAQDTGAVVIAGVRYRGKHRSRRDGRAVGQQGERRWDVRVCHWRARERHKPSFRSHRCVRVQAGSRDAAVYGKNGARRKTQDSPLNNCRYETRGSDTSRLNEVQGQNPTAPLNAEGPRSFCGG